MTIQYGKPGSVSRSKVKLTLSAFAKRYTRPSNQRLAQTRQVMETIDAICIKSENDYLKAQAEVVV